MSLLLLLRPQFTVEGPLAERFEPTKPYLAYQLGTYSNRPLHKKRRRWCPDVDDPAVITATGMQIGTYNDKPLQLPTAKCVDGKLPYGQPIPGAVIGVRNGKPLVFGACHSCCPCEEYTSPIRCTLQLNATDTVQFNLSYYADLGLSGWSLPAFFFLGGHDRHSGWAGPGYYIAGSPPGTCGTLPRKQYGFTLTICKCHMLPVIYWEEYTETSSCCPQFTYWNRTDGGTYTACRNPVNLGQGCCNADDSTTCSPFSVTWRMNLRAAYHTDLLATTSTMKLCGTGNGDNCEGDAFLTIEPVP